MDVPFLKHRAIVVISVFLREHFFPSRKLLPNYYSKQKHDAAELYVFLSALNKATLPMVLRS